MNTTYTRDIRKLRKSNRDSSDQRMDVISYMRFDYLGNNYWYRLCDNTGDNMEKIGTLA